MNRFIQSILKIKTLYIFLSLLVITFITDFTFYEYISTNEINRISQHERQVAQEAEIYNEHDDLMADFKDDLAEIDLEQVEDNPYAWDSFIIDIQFTSIPMIMICLGISFFILIGFHFTRQYHNIPFRDVFKSSLFAYCIFPLGDLFECIWFGLIRTEYTVEDLQQMYRILHPSIQSLIGSPIEYQWYNYLLTDINIQSLIFVLLISFFIKSISQTNYIDLLKKTVIPIFGFLILYQISYTLYFDLLFSF